jgi:hypothetical protein
MSGTKVPLSALIAVPETLPQESTGTSVLRAPRPSVPQHLSTRGVS